MKRSGVRDEAYDNSERQEILALEALSKRAAVLRRLRATVGPDLEMDLDMIRLEEALSLHRELLVQTKAVVACFRALKVARFAASSNNEPAQDQGPQRSGES